MKTFGILTFVGLALLPVSAQAGDRGTDAAIGAVSGAVVFGPVGAVAGALVGFTAGPAIGHSWGVGGSSGRPHSSRQRAARRDTGQSRASYDGTMPADTAATTGSVPAQPAAAARAEMTRTKAPPVQTLE